MITSRVKVESEGNERVRTGGIEVVSQGLYFQTLGVFQCRMRE